MLCTMHRVRISWLSIGAENIPNKKKRFFPFYFVSHPNELWSLVSICWLSLVVISNIFLHFDASTPGDFYYIALNSTIPKRCQLFNSEPFSVVLFVVRCSFEMRWLWNDQITENMINWLAMNTTNQANKKNNAVLLSWQINGNKWL